MNLFRKYMNEKGNSFLEVMIALVLTGIITTSVFKAYLIQNENYIIQDDVMNIQQNARASIDEIARNVRMSGYDLPLGVPALIAYNTDPDTIVLNFRSEECDTYLSDPMPQPSSELKCATDVSCFEDGQWVYIFEPDSGGGEWFEITAVQAAAKHIQHNTMALSRKYGADAILLAMYQVKYYIDTSDADHPNLMIEKPGMNPIVFAENISDLQFEYRMKNGNTYDVPPLIDDLREVIISVEAKSNYDAEMSDRERVYTTSVFMRNIGL